jgi:hypothetical protein
VTISVGPVSVEVESRTRFAASYLFVVVDARRHVPVRVRDGGEVVHGVVAVARRDRPARSACERLRYGDEPFEGVVGVPCVRVAWFSSSVVRRRPSWSYA